MGIGLESGWELIWSRFGVGMGIDLESGWKLIWSRDGN